MRCARDGVSALASALRDEGGVVAELVKDQPASSEGLEAPGPAQLAAAGPRAAGRETEYELLVEMILEGSRLHYGRARVVHTDDRDLALLVGDHLYALGLERLAALDDVEAIGELADVISLVAQAHAANDSRLADAVWDAGGIAVGWGENAAHEAAKELARAGEDRALAALRESSRSPSS